MDYQLVLGVFLYLKIFMTFLLNHNFLPPATFKVMKKKSVMKICVLFTALNIENNYFSASTLKYLTVHHKR
jgi:hypothetical protein